MTIRNFSVVTIPVRWCSAPCLALCGALLLAGAAPTQHKPASKTSSKAASKAASKPAVAPATLAALVRAYRELPSPARRAAVESWGTTHPKERAASQLALGVVGYELRDYVSGIAALRKAQPGLPLVADYTAYYLAAMRVESRDFGGIVRDLAPTHSSEIPSPFSARARLLEARALKDSAPAEAVRLLREHAAELPQPEGDLTLAEAEQAAGNQAGAVEAYERVYCQYVTGDTAVRAATALASLRSAMGAPSLALSARQMLRHADRLLEVREVAQARAEYRTLAEHASAAERDLALVGLGAAEYLGGKSPTAAEYLRTLEVAAPEAEAERLYYLVECARRVDNESELKQALKRLESQFATSPWCLKALVSGANYFLLSNRAEDYVPLYRAVYRNFPADPAAGLSHWKVAFDAHLHRRSDAVALMREQLVDFPRSGNAGAALYFLGRSAEERRDYAEAAAYYQHLLRVFENYYYAMLARERMLRPEVRGAAPSPKTSAFLAGLTLPVSKPVPLAATHQTAVRMERSQALRAAGLSDLADSELRFGARTDGQPALLAMEAAKAADSAGMALHVLKTMVPDHLGIPLAAAPRHFWELLYPLPYRAELFADARERELDPYVVAGLIRQESEFNPGAVSPAKAYGLMQVLPVTGKQYARTAGVPKFSTPLLLQPAVNLRIGTFVFRKMLEHSGGHLEQTLAAYNAGPMRLAEWVTWNSPHEPAEFVESIPFTETREYVQAVLRNADMYRRLYP
jgi:soluble lytic murein transglycosylase